MKEKTFILKKRCRVTYTNNFVIEGIILEIDEHGIVFKTSQKTSFISFNSIRDIQPME